MSNGSNHISLINRPLGMRLFRVLPLNLWMSLCDCLHSAMVSCVYVRAAIRTVGRFAAPSLFCCIVCTSQICRRWPRCCRTMMEMIIAVEFCEPTKLSFSVHRLVDWHSDVIFFIWASSTQLLFMIMFSLSLSRRTHHHHHQYRQGFDRFPLVCHIDSPFSSMCISSSGIPLFWCRCDCLRTRLCRCEINHENEQTSIENMQKKNEQIQWCNDDNNRGKLFKNTRFVGCHVHCIFRRCSSEWKNEKRNADIATAHAENQHSGGWRFVLMKLFFRSDDMIVFPSPIQPSHICIGLHRFTPFDEMLFDPLCVKLSF